MQFCPACDNILHMQIGQLEKDNTQTASQIPLTMYCKHCPYKIDVNQTSTQKELLFNPCLYRSNYSSNHSLYYSNLVNHYTFDDPALPRIDMDCQNTECTSHKDDVQSEILYVRFNDKDMRYMYLCKHCRQCWTLTPQNETDVIFDFSKQEGIPAP
jgi:DNA-directed RNA polymerase subunit M/transcription elongation factor TFIIS